ncbi:superoxide dismutase family protein [Azospirillum sp. YIM DDC1]|uniref:Superoxide dismutase family protein n=1 Tax=Azospirillum aestuarii TaxID=2802052 RepID=A0ABS1I8K0_9PROT|nr:superoxide dismutase family protein [Azospirillum aestuarii]MBK4723296.1 superoxide dismutase family protein [Azospirillum aestuarii]
MNPALVAATAVICLAAPALAQTANQGRTALPAPPAGQALAQAGLVDAAGQTIGTAAFIQTPSGVLIQLRLDKIPPGVHGLHIHENARCQPPDFQSAGGHFNPGGRSHGLLDQGGPHAGDLPNVAASQNGQVWADILTDRVTLGTGTDSLFGGNGTALVLHATPDDYRTDPAGAAGGRVACGPIMRMTQPR